MERSLMGPQYRNGRCEVVTVGRHAAGYNQFHHSVQRYAATEFDSRAKVSSVIRAGGVCGKFELAQNLRLSLLNRRH
jgi:hypothetical protein